MKKFFTLFILASCLLAGGNAWGQPCSNFNRLFPSSTQTITLGQSNILIGNMYGGDYVACSVTSGATYTWSTCGNTAFDTQLTLWNDTHTISYADSDDDCPSGLQSSIIWTATFTGTVHVLLSEYDCIVSTSTIPLRWSARAAGGLCSNFDLGQYPSATQTIAPGTSNQHIGYNYGGEYAACNVTNGITYTWSTCGDTEFDTQLSLWNTAHTTSYANNDNACGLQSSITWTATFTGTVHVLVSEYPCTWNQSPTTLKWSASNGTPCSNVTPLTCNSPQSFTLSGAGAWNWNTQGYTAYGQEKIFSFTPPTSGDWVIDMSPITGGAVNVGLKSNSCTATAGDWSGLPNINAPSYITLFSLTAGTTYYILFDALASSPAVNLTIEIYCQPPNDLCANATSLACGQNTTGTTVGTTAKGAPVSSYASPYGVWYTFTGDGQATTITSTSTRTGFDHTIGIYTGTCGNLTHLHTQDEDYELDNSTETYTFVTVLGTTYFVYIAYYDVNGTAINWETGTFTISRSCTPALSCAAATPMACGQTYSNTLSGTRNYISESFTDCFYHGYGEVNVFSFTPAVTGAHDFTVANVSGDIDFYIMSSCSHTSTNISSANSYGGCWEGSTTPDTRTVTLTAGTTYYLFCDNYNNSPSTYEVKVECPAPPCAAPTAVTAGTITPSGATITWTAPSSAPSNGYDVYVSSSASPAPTAGTTPTQNVSGTSYTYSSGNPCTAYYVWVRSNCGSGLYSSWTAMSPSSFTTTVSAPTAGSVITSPICTGSTPTLNATATAGATIQWFTSSSGGISIGSSASGDNFTAPAITSNTTYWAEAVVGSCTSPTRYEVGTVTVTPALTVSITPYPAAIVCPDVQMTLTANESGGDGSNYAYSWTTSDGGTIISGNNTATPTVTAGKYIVTVTSGGCSAKDSTTVTVTPCPCTVPVLTIDNVSYASAQVSWTGSAPEWLLEWGTTGNFTNIVPVSSSPYTIEGLQPETEYNVRIRTICAPSDTSAYSNVDTFTTLRQPCYAPTLSVSNEESTSATITWTSSGNDTEIEYLLEYGMNNSYGAPISVTQPYDLTGLTPSRTYCVRMRTVCGVGDTSAYSNVRCFETPLCHRPTNVRAEVIGNTIADISWLPGRMETEWLLEYGVQGTAGTSIYVNTPSPFRITDLQPNTCYYVHMKAICAADEYSAYSNIDSFCTPQIPCPDPTNLTVENSTDHTITISWERGGDETQWRIEYSSTGFTGQVITSTRPHTLVDLQSNAYYYICVVAICAPGVESDRSNCINGTTLDDIGISDITLPNSVKLYPNPTADKLTVEMENKFNTLEITNTLGQMLYRIPVTDNQMQIDVSGYSAGMYYVKLQGDNGMITKKFVKE